MYRFVAVVIVVIVACVVATEVSLGQDFCDGHPDCLGVYFDDETFQENCLAFASSFVPIDLYFVVKNVSQADLGGFALAWRFEPEPAIEPLLVELVLPPGAGDVADYHDLVVNLEEPIPTVPTMVLAKVVVLFITPPWQHGIYVGPSPNGLLLDQAYAYDGSDPPQAVPFYLGEFASEGWAPLACLACWCHGAPVESSTWGDIKATYH